MDTLLEIYNRLPPELQREMVDYAQYLSQKSMSITKKKMQFNWVGAIRDFRGQYTSLELQKQGMKWWTE